MKQATIKTSHYYTSNQFRSSNQLSNFIYIYIKFLEEKKVKGDMSNTFAKLVGHAALSRQWINLLLISYGVCFT